MKSLPFAFVATAILAGLIGMVWGIMMAASGDHTLAPGHAHLNLLGWVTLAIYGFYYHTVPAAIGRLGWVHYVLSLASVVTVGPGIAIAIATGSEGLAILGSFLALGALLLFAIVVLRNRVP